MSITPKAGLHSIVAHPFMKYAVLPGILAILLVGVLANGGDDSPDVNTASGPATTVAPDVAEFSGDTPDTLPDASAFADPEVTSDYPFASGAALAAVVADAEEAAAAEAEAEAAAAAADTTQADTGGTASAGGSTASAPVAQPVRIPSPSCGTLGAPVSQTAPLTGLSASIPSGMPAVVVKVSNNSSASRASLIGLDQADVIFEERIEASATRFYSVFHSSLPENVGPVRSGRTTDIQLSENLNNPIFGYSGSNAGVARQLSAAAGHGLITLFPNTDSSPFARDSRFSAPDNLMVSPAGLGACGSGSPRPIFSFGAANSGTAQPASSVSLSARSSYRFDWNGSTWTRSQSGYQHTTRDGSALAPNNVVVMFVPYTQSAVDAQSVDAQSVGSGEAWILRDGTITVGGWSRARGIEPYTFTDGNGSAINLSPGQTWVVLAPAGTASWS